MITNNPYNVSLTGGGGHPDFSVDFSLYNQKNTAEKKPLHKKVLSVILKPLESIKIIFRAIKNSGSKTLSYAGVSFKHIVLGYYGDISSYRPTFEITLILFKTAFWIFQLTRCFFMNACSLIYKDIEGGKSSNEKLLGRFADGIDLSHMKTSQTAIDVSRIPATVVVGDLKKMFEEINFDKPGKDGYMAPTSLQEGKTLHTKADLKKSLDVFIDHVKKRTAFLGTPPQYDTPQLMKFYEQIENSVRFCIDKVNRDLQEFYQRNGSDSGNYGEKEKKEHYNLLENRARVAINLAIAGKYCGARYMGEATELYHLFSSDESAVKGTLQDTLNQLLAQKRGEIAKRQIARNMGAGVHDFGNYMDHLGQMLAIPGTENIVEHLSKNFDTPHYLKLFFDEYNADFILDAIQEKVIKSNPFREQILDWIRDQAGNWDKEAYDKKVQTSLARIQEILGKNEVDVQNKSYQKLQVLKRLVAHCKEAGEMLLLSYPERDDFLNEFFASDMVRQWMKENNASGLKILFSDDKYGQPLFEAVKKACLDKADLQLESAMEQTIIFQKKSQISADFPDLQSMQDDTLVRIIKGETPVQESLKNFYDRERGRLLCLAVLKKSARDINHTDLKTGPQTQTGQVVAGESTFEDKAGRSSDDEDEGEDEEDYGVVFAQKGLSPLVLEWIVVSQKILQTQHSLQDYKKI